MSFYLFNLTVFLQNQIDDITNERDFSLREAELQELLFGQCGLIVEKISQYLHIKEWQQIYYAPLTACHEPQLPL